VVQQLNPRKTHTTAAISLVNDAMVLSSDLFVD